MTTRAGATATCCGEPWIAEYVDRVRAMMRTFERGDRGHVYWLTLPTPRDPRRVPIFAAVNRAILRAAEGEAGVTILRMDELFSPHGYRATIRYRGRDVDIASRMASTSTSAARRSPRRRSSRHSRRPATADQRALRRSVRAGSPS